MLTKVDLFHNLICKYARNRQCARWIVDFFPNLASVFLRRSCEAAARCLWLVDGALSRSRSGIWFKSHLRQEVHQLLSIRPYPRKPMVMIQMSKRRPLELTSGADGIAEQMHLERLSDLVTGNPVAALCADIHLNAPKGQEF